MQKQLGGRQKLLDRDGIATVGELVSPGDILINKQTPLSTKDPLPGGMGHGPLPDSFYKPAPLSWKGPPGEAAIVDRVLLTNNEDGHLIVKVHCHLLSVRLERWQRCLVWACVPGRLLPRRSGTGVTYPYGVAFTAWDSSQHNGRCS